MTKQLKKLDIKNAQLRNALQHLNPKTASSERASQNLSHQTASSEKTLPSTDSSLEGPPRIRKAVLTKDSGTEGENKPSRTSSIYSSEELHKKSLQPEPPVQIVRHSQSSSPSSYKEKRESFQRNRQDSSRQEPNHRAVKPLSSNTFRPAPRTFEAAKHSSVSTEFQRKPQGVRQEKEGFVPRPRQEGRPPRKEFTPRTNGTFQRPPTERRTTPQGASGTYSRPSGPRPPLGRTAPGRFFPPASPPLPQPANRRTHSKARPPTGRDDERKKKRILEQTREFDGRDRQGLRDTDDEPTRIRFSPKNRSQRETLEYLSRPREISISLPISVKDLAGEMKIKAGELLPVLLSSGITCTLNDLLDDPVIIQLVGSELGCSITIDTSKQDRLNVTEQTIQEEISSTNEALLKLRPPVITFMGHVDHGKTSLIDALRKSDLASKEAGAITQHMGAFSCRTESGMITVLDTPGHEAFSAIRSRGSKVTDIVVLVVAGDEGFKIQTDEAIKHALAAGVVLIFALNKSDKPGFDPELVYRQMADRGLLPEPWGGTVPVVHCSALTGEGISDLMELLVLQSQVLELKANYQFRARGTTLEAELIKGLGPSATIIVQNGTLHVGDAILFGEVYGKVKLIQDEHGKQLKLATPGLAVRITGLSSIPECGSEFIVVSSEKEARKISEQRIAEGKKTTLRTHSINLSSMLQQKSEKMEKKIYNLILKADVQGSLEALRSSLFSIETKKVHLQIVSEGLGMISLSDAELAKTSGATILGFHTKMDRSIESFVRNHQISIKLYDIIYHLIEEVKADMKNLLDKVRVESESSRATVRATFKSSNIGIIAGCFVLEGTVKRGQLARVYRSGTLIYEGTIASLKRVKEDVKEVNKGHECGILLKDFSNIQVDDEIRTYDVTFIEQEL